MTRGKGYKPDPTGRARTDVRVMLERRGLSLATELPPQASLLEHGPKIFDQGSTGSCTGHAIARALATRFSFIGAPLPWVPSPAEIYRVGRCIDRRDPRTPLEDDGAQPNQVVRGVEEWGVVAMGPRPADGRYSDADPASINAEPQLADLEAAASTLILGDFAITSTGAQRVLELRSAIAHGFPITCAVDATDDSPIQRYTGGVLASMGTTLDHYVFLGAYREGAAGPELGFVNSWSEGWGEDGVFWMAGTAIDQLGDIVAFDPMKVVGA